MRRLPAAAVVIATLVLAAPASALHVRAPAGLGEAGIEEDSGGGFRRVATATPKVTGGHEEHEGAGMLHATVAPATSASYRAMGPAGASPPLRLEVTDRATVALAAAIARGGTRLRVSTAPPQPGARVVLQLRLRERFGWWTVARGRLDAHSRTRFLLRRSRRVRARAVLLGANWATVLAASRSLLLRPRSSG